VAYSKTPEGDTHSVKRVPAVGSPFVIPNTADVVPVTLNYYNCFPTREKQFGQEPKYYVEKRKPYFTDMSVSTSPNVNPSFSQWVIAGGDINEIYFARNDTYYEVIYTGSGTSPTIASIGTFASAYLTDVTLANNSTNERRIVAMAGTTVNTWLDDGSGFTTTVITPNKKAGCGLVYLNGYLFTIADNYMIYNSTAGGVLTTWATTDYIDAEIYPDLPVRLGKHHNYLVVFGNNSTEFFIDGAVELGSPLVRQENLAAQIGIAFGQAGGTKSLAYMGDDMYFVGKSIGSNYKLCRIRDFKVEMLDHDALEYILNSPVSEATALKYHSIETWTVNNETMIMIKMASASGLSTAMMYFPEIDSWWTMDLMDSTGVVNNTSPWEDLVGNQFHNDYWNRASGGRTPWFLACGSNKTSATVDIYTQDKDFTVSNTATIWTDIIDMDNNRWKHWYKVEAVGNYGANVLTLSICESPTYTPFTALTPTMTQSTLGASNNLMWNNCGMMRQGIIKLDMVGAAFATHTGFEISYNLHMQ
jgi:hypothetical protein